MTEQEALDRMVAPGTRRPGKYREGVIQIHVTRACDESCFNCTQGSNLAGPVPFMTLEQFEEAILFLREYFGVVGVFGGNPAMHPQFPELCAILRRHIPFEQRGLWCNNPRTSENARAMRETFNPSVSNLNVHLDASAYSLFKEYWPESRPFGLHDDSRHSPCYVALKDVLHMPCPDCRGFGWIESGDLTCSKCNGTGQIYDEGLGWELISNCDINQHWSAMIGVFRGELRAWFCEIAGAQAMLHQFDKDYPDTGLDPTASYMLEGLKWWRLPMQSFGHQIRKHCHECGVPLRGEGELAQAMDGLEQVSAIHEKIYRPKRKGRSVELVTVRSELGSELQRMTDYLGNAKR